ncbi:MAG: hypothetical protein M3336_14295 [Chloroflexota bacterium]|nr:hypothetical protein [Chloroflexota bacterium]
METQYSWLPPEQTLITSSCGMNHLPRHIAFGKLKAMAEAKRILLDRAVAASHWASALTNDWWRPHLPESRLTGAPTRQAPRAEPSKSAMVRHAQNAAALDVPGRAVPVPSRFPGIPAGTRSRVIVAEHDCRGVRQDCRQEHPARRQQRYAQQRAAL